MAGPQVATEPYNYDTFRRHMMQEDMHLPVIHRKPGKNP